MLKVMMWDRIVCRISDDVKQKWLLTEPVWDYEELKRKPNRLKPTFVEQGARDKCDLKVSNQWTDQDLSLRVHGF